MARRINTYQWLRKLHLYAGFMVLGFLFMYFLTGYMITHAQWFPRPEPEINTQTYPLNAPENLTPEQLSAYVQNKHKLWGKRQPPQVNKEGEITLNYARPGHHYQARVTPDRQTLEVKTTQQNMYATFVVFHRLHGYGGGWVYNLYILMMDLSSIALIIFVLTGIYMWFKLLRKKALGWILLGISLAYTFVVIYTFLFG